MNDIERKYDKFYTKRDLSKRLINFSLFSVLIYEDFFFEDFLFLDPCAGEGSFYDYLPEPKIGMDILPEEGRNDILKQDFLKWYPKGIKQKIFIISNFPFGKNSSLAVKFLNHAADFSEFICCILPKTFDKFSIRKRINKNILLFSKIEIEKNSFLFKNKPYDVPCNFYLFKKNKIDENFKIFIETEDKKNKNRRFCVCKK